MAFSLSPVPYDGLASADLTIGRVYKGGPQPNVGADPLHRLTGVGNTGGFRTKRLKGTQSISLCVLFSTGTVSVWPDGWTRNGDYAYFGDQKEPGKDVLDTPRKGNRLLADVAAMMRRGPEGRIHVPPFLLFEKASQGRDVRFQGLLVPSPNPEWLTIQHRTGPEGEFANYRALFRRLPTDEISRMWLMAVLDGRPHSQSAPGAWRRWVSSGS